MGFSNNTPLHHIDIGDRSSRSTEPAVNFRPLTIDTDGSNHPSLAAEYALYLENRPIQGVSEPHLTFRFRATHPFTASPNSRCGIFTPNLWLHDCGEFFLSNPSTGRYLEVNLNPHGAWWAASFNAPRQKHRDEPFDNAHCSAASISDMERDSLAPTWSAAISIPLDALETVLETAIVNLTANVTAILATPNQVFLTAAPLGGEQPDFHRPGDWLPVRVAGRPC